MSHPMKHRGDMETLVDIVTNPNSNVKRRAAAKYVIYLDLDEMNGAGWSILPAHTRKDLIKIVAGPMATVPLEAAHV